MLTPKDVAKYREEDTAKGDSLEGLYAQVLQEIQYISKEDNIADLAKAALYGWVPNR